VTKKTHKSFLFSSV